MINIEEKIKELNEQYDSQYDKDENLDIKFSKELKEYLNKKIQLPIGKSFIVNYNTFSIDIIYKEKPIGSKDNRILTIRNCYYKKLCSEYCKDKDVYDNDFDIEISFISFEENISYYKEVLSVLDSITPIFPEIFQIIKSNTKDYFNIFKERCDIQREINSLKEEKREERESVYSQYFYEGSFFKTDKFESSTHDIKIVRTTDKTIWFECEYMSRNVMRKIKSNFVDLLYRYEYYNRNLLIEKLLEE